MGSLIVRYVWMEKVTCTQNPELFFPDKSETKKIAKAKAICNSCAVKEQCLRLAMKFLQEEGELDGIWGGTTPDERNAIRRFVDFQNLFDAQAG